MDKPIINNVTCTNCKAIYNGEQLRKTLDIGKPIEVSCECGYNIKITYEVTMCCEIKYTSAYKKEHAHV